MVLRVQPQKPPLQALLAKCGFMLGAFDNGLNTKTCCLNSSLCEKELCYYFVFLYKKVSK